MKKLLLLLFTVIILGLMFLLIKSTKSSPENLSSIKNFTLIIKNKKLVSGPETLKTTQGDTVVIAITNDTDEELHLHGYDKSVELEKDKPTELTIVAKISGRFIYELERSKTDIGALEVQPK